MSPKETANYDNILYVLKKRLKDKVGILSLNRLFIEAEMDDIIQFMDNKKITAPRTKVQSIEYLKIIALNYYHNFINDPKLTKQHGDVLPRHQARQVRLELHQSHAPFGHILVHATQRER